MNKQILSSDKKNIKKKKPLLIFGFSSTGQYKRAVFNLAAYIDNNAVYCTPRWGCSILPQHYFLVDIGINIVDPRSSIRKVY